RQRDEGAWLRVRLPRHQPPRCRLGAPSLPHRLRALPPLRLRPHTGAGARRARRPLLLRRRRHGPACPDGDRAPLRRRRGRLHRVQAELRGYYWDFLPTGDLAELRNLATVAELVIACAASRPESRGLHYTIDHPRTDPAWAHDTVVRRCDGEPPDVVRQPA